VPRRRDRQAEGGPNTTPTIDGDRVYTLSRTGALYCLRLADGRPVWRKHLKDDFGGKPGSWGYSASPVVDGDLLYVLPCSKNGGFFALNKSDGSVAWNTRDVRRSGYSAPLITTIDGKKAALVFDGRALVAHDLGAKGKVLFEFPWKTSYDVNASNPQYHDGKVFVASGYGMGYTVLDVTGKKPKVLHQDHDIRMIFQNSVRTGDTITGVFGDKRIDAELIRMDLASGKILWRQAMPGTRASSALVGDTFVLLSETGELVAGKATDKGFAETGRKSILKRRCWSPFAVAGGKLFARNNNGDAICLDVSP
jgi:outer membrane protein assembly factor BamB